MGRWTLSWRMIMQELQCHATCLKTSSANYTVMFLMPCIVALLSIVLTLAAHAAPCTAVEKAIEAGMKQSRIYAASFEQLPDGKTGKAFMSAITIDSTHYLFEGNRSFGATHLESAEMRNLGSGLIGFLPGKTCNAQGVVTIAGKQAEKFQYTNDLGNGPANITL